MWSEINSLLCSVPQKADNMKTLIQLRTTNLVRLGDRKKDARVALHLPAAGSSKWWHLFPDLSGHPFPMWSLMFCSWVLIMHGLLLVGSKFLLLLILGLYLCAMACFLVLLTLFSSSLYQIYFIKLLEISSVFPMRSYVY